MSAPACNACVNLLPEFIAVGVPLRAYLVCTVSEPRVSPAICGPFFFLAKVVYYRMNQRHPFLITPVVVAGVGRDDQEGQRSEVAHHSLESLRMLATALAACKYKRPCLVCGGNTCTVTALSAQACMTMPRQSRTA